MLTQTIAQYSASEIGTEVRAGLTKAGQKELPSKYLYDEVGSALFEAISVIPEYGLTRADERLLQKFAGKIVAHLPSPVLVAELGSGSGKKTRWILEALSSRQRTFYYPIEISPTALAQCKKELGQIDLVSVVGYARPYLDGLLAVAARRLPRERLLVLFLGSTIGNFDRDAGEEFLSEVRRILAPGDALLLSSDLVKPAGMRPSAASKCICAPCATRPSESPARGFLCASPKKKPYGRKARTNTSSRKSPKAPRASVSVAKRNGLTRNGPLPRAC